MDKAKQHRHKLFTLIDNLKFPIHLTSHHMHAFRQWEEAEEPEKATQTKGKHAKYISPTFNLTINK